MKESQVIAEIEAALRGTEGPRDAFTTLELAEMLGLGLDATRRRLHLLKATGRLEVLSVTRPTLSGQFRRVAGYRILPSEEEGRGG
jgi:hypothetical protein